MLHRNAWAFATSALAVAVMGSRSFAGVCVDLNADESRRDAISPMIENWNITSNASQHKVVDGVTVTIESIGAEPTAVMWKGGIQSAPMASDGLVLNSKDPAAHFQITLSGLTPGRHTLTTFHNAPDEDAMPAVLRLTSGESNSLVRPTVRTGSDWDLPSAHISIVADAQGNAVAKLERGDNSTQQLVLNGFAIDQSNPEESATHPSPAWGDMHADVASQILRWRSPRLSYSFNVYLGTDADAVAKAVPGSAEHLGNVTSEAIGIDRKLSNHQIYYWRVDTLDRAGKATPSPIWQFRPRQLAFPGAEGYGRFAIGGRGGKVYHVTSLEDSGPGTLREAVEASGPRTVVFRTGGAIHLKSRLLIHNPYITIAGQTAPGDGIAVYGQTFGMLGARDAILRYVRIRPGDANRARDGTGFASSDHAIMDHCSVSWSSDEAVSSRGARNITFQRSIVAEALNPRGHGFAGSISGEIGSFHHNLVAHCSGRNWSLAGGFAQSGDEFGGYLDIRNNVVYNWFHRTTDGGVRYLNFVGNYYIPGPASQPEIKHFVIARIENRLPQDVQRFYIAGNRMEGHPEYDADNWANGGVRSEARDHAAVKMLEPFCPSYITEHPADQTYENVMQDVGANLPYHDSVDTRVLNDVRKRSFTVRGSRGNLPGIIDSQKDVGGYPEMKTGEAPEDADLDGIADWWEKANGLDPTNPEDRNADRNDDGYTNLEEYLNWIVSNGGLNPSK